MEEKEAKWAGGEEADWEVNWGQADLQAVNEVLAAKEVQLEPAEVSSLPNEVTLPGKR